MNNIFDIAPLSIWRKHYDHIKFVRNFAEAHELEYNINRMMLREFLLHTICEKQTEEISRLNARIAELEA